MATKKATEKFVVVYQTAQQLGTNQYALVDSVSERGAITKTKTFVKNAKGENAQSLNAIGFYDFAAAQAEQVESVIGIQARTMSKDQIQTFFSFAMGMPTDLAERIAAIYVTFRHTYAVAQPATTEPAAPVVEPTAKAAEYVPTEDEISHELAAIEDEESALRAAHEALWDVETLDEFEEWQSRHPLIGLVRRKDGAKVVAYRVYPHTEGVIEFDLENGRQSWPFYRMIARYFFPICL